MSAVWRYLTGPDDPETLAQAVAEITPHGGGPRLQAALSDRLECADCQARLAEYAQALDLGAVLPPALEAVTRHLAHCEACAADFLALQEYSLSAETADQPAPPVPAPDLSFLPDAPAPGTAVLWRQVETARRCVVALQMAVGQAGARFMGLPHHLQIV